MLSSRCRYSFQSSLYYVHNNFQHFHLYSTKSPNQSNNSPENHQIYSDYLVNNLGLSPQKALSASTRLRFKYGNYFKFCDNANSVVDFLKQHDFDDTHIIKIVFSYPQILTYNVDKTLKPKFKLLQDYGCSGFNLISVISKNPKFLSTDMDKIINDLKEIMGSNENMVKLFRSSHFFMTSSGLINIALLKNGYGVDNNAIRNGILHHSASYLRKPEFFRNILIRVEEELGIPRNSGMFLYGVYLLCNYSKETMDSKCQLLKSFGWTEYDISELIRRQPNLFVISEENMRKKLGFLMTELGYKPDFIATRACLLGFSLEKRLAPRHRVLSVLKEKDLLDCTFYTAVLKNEKQFLQMLESFKEDVPGLLELYQSSKGCCNTISKRC
ncbi:uncharacterized protein LOC141586009 [Silene latifolia]|uniref:uncharacterized protein LOC141586009 n=1 Tax=Silene latifolia TaxID=37657 RepID=UPI003D78968D